MSLSTHYKNRALDAASHAVMLAGFSVTALIASVISRLYEAGLWLACCSIITVILASLAIGHASAYVCLTRLSEKEAEWEAESERCRKL